MINSLSQLQILRATVMDCQARYGNWYNTGMTAMRVTYFSLTRAEALCKGEKVCLLL